MSETTLWYKQPATDENAALPVGNGHLGARVFGGIEHERLQLTEESLPSLGDLFIEQVLAGPSKNYRHALDLETAVVTTGFTVKSTRFTREAFASTPDNVLIVRLQSDTPGSLNLTIRLTHETLETLEVKAMGREGLALRGQLQSESKATHFACFVRARIEGGALRANENGTIQIAAADRVTLFLTADTSGKGHDPETALEALDSLFHKPYTELSARHQAEHQRLFRRTTLSLPATWHHRE